jgi:hypothetical protein
VLLLFIAGIGYLGLLAYTPDDGRGQFASSTGGHPLLGLVFVGFAVAAVLGVIATRFKRLR